MGGQVMGQTPPSQPRLVCNEPVFDFGVRPNSVEVDHDFTIRNAGELPLVISQVRSGVGEGDLGRGYSEISNGGAGQ